MHLVSWDGVTWDSAARIQGAGKSLGKHRLGQCRARDGVCGLWAPSCHPNSPMRKASSPELS